MADIVLFNGVPPVAPAVFGASDPVMISAERLPLDFRCDMGGVVGTLNWFLEFSSDPTNAAEWFAEVAEEDIGAGVTHMPLVLRDFTAVPINVVTRFSTQFVRTHKFARVRFRSTAGTWNNLRIICPIGVPIIAAS